MTGPALAATSPPSVWLDGPAPPRRPPLERDASADVAIVGAGIAGLSVAYALAREGLRPIVLERDAIAHAATGRNAGFVLAGVAENFVAACRRFGAEPAARVWRFTVTNRVLLGALARRHRIDCDLAWNGSVQLAGDADEWQEIQESARALGGHGVRVSLDPASCSACYEDDGELDPVRFALGLAAVSEGLGARIHEGTTVTEVRSDGVTAARGSVRAGAVVVCANAYSEHVLPRSRVVPVRGQMLATAPLAARVFPKPVYAHRGYRYWRQTADGRALVGGWRDTAVDEEVGEEARLTERIQRQLDAFLAEHGVRAPVTHRWGGIMGFSHDGLPYIGRRADGIYIHAGFTGHGNAFAVAGGELIGALIRSGRHLDADLFDPERT